MRGADVKAVSPAKRGRSGATRLDAGEHTRTLTVRRYPSTTTTSCGRRKLGIRHFLAVANSRLLVLHSATGYRERAAGVTLSVGNQSQEGLSLSQRWGDAAAGSG